MINSVILARGDRVAADVVGLGMIKSYGKWSRVANEDVWEQKQIKKALALGLGVGPGQIMLRDKALKGHYKDFGNIVN